MVQRGKRCEPEQRADDWDRLAGMGDLDLRTMRGGIEVAESIREQAKQRHLEHLFDEIMVPKEKVVSTVASHGNTSAASIPLALHTAVADGRIKPGDLVMIEECRPLSKTKAWRVVKLLEKARTI